MSELMPILRDRRSIRAFDPSHELSSAAVDVLLEADRRDAHLTHDASMDLASHQFAAFDHAGLAAAADVPPHWQVTTGIAIGRAIESDVRQRERRPLEEFAYGATFGQPRSG